MITVRRLLQRKGTEIWSVAPETSVLEAMHLMAEKDIGAVLVLDGPDVVGIFSERDAARRVTAMEKKARQTLVQQVMTPMVISVRPDTSLLACLQVMTDNHIRHLPVIDGEKLVGIITLGDVVKRIIANQAEQIDRLETMISENE